VDNPKVKTHTLPMTVFPFRETIIRIFSLNYFRNKNQKKKKKKEIKKKKKKDQNRVILQTSMKTLCNHQ